MYGVSISCCTKNDDTTDFASPISLGVNPSRRHRNFVRDLRIWHTFYLDHIPVTRPGLYTPSHSTDDDDATIRTETTWHSSGQGRIDFRSRSKGFLTGKGRFLPSRLDTADGGWLQLLATWNGQFRAQAESYAYVKDLRDSATDQAKRRDRLRLLNYSPKKHDHTGA